MLHHGQTASCQDSNFPAGLDCLLASGTPPLCSRLDCLHCTSPGVLDWRHGSIPWIRLTVEFWGLQGLLGHMRLLLSSSWYRALYFLLAALNCCISAA